MRLLIVILFALHSLSAQTPGTELLHTKLLVQLNTIVRTTDGIVGIAVKDLRSGELIEFNSQEPFPTASSIKVFILAEVYRQAAEGKFSLTDIRPVPAAARVGGSGILSMLGERSVSMSIRDYCVLMMNQSDNTATNLLIGLVGMKNVTALAAKYGCSATKLQRVMMDLQAAKEGRENISSPADLLLFLEKLHSGAVVSKAASDDMLAMMSLEKDGWLKSGLPPAVGIANKAGDLDGVKCDAGIVSLDGAPYAIVVMTKMLLNDADGARTITDVSHAVYGYLERAAHSNAHGRRISR